MMRVKSWPSKSVKKSLLTSREENPSSCDWLLSPGGSFLKDLWKGQGGGGGQILTPKLWKEEEEEEVFLAFLGFSRIWRRKKISRGGKRVFRRKRRKGRHFTSVGRSQKKSWQIERSRKRHISGFFANLLRANWKGICHNNWLCTY